MPPDLSIIIVTWNSRADIAKCLESLAVFCAGNEVEIIVFDNASTDGTADFVAAHFPQVVLISSKVNMGFARGNNLAAQKAAGRYLLFLNPDTWVNADLAAALAKFLDAHPQAGACAPRFLNPDGSLQRGAIRTLPTLATLFYDLSGCAKIFSRRRRFGGYMMTWWDHHETREVEQPAGACLAVRREVFSQIHGFDEGYFMYYEDVELCRAILAAGWKIYFLHDACVYHVGGQSTSQAVPKNFPEFYRSQYRYFHRRHGRFTAWIAKFMVGLAELSKLVALLPLLPFAKFLPRPPYWCSRWEQFGRHVRFLLQHWFY